MPGVHDITITAPTSDDPDGGDPVDFVQIIEASEHRRQLTFEWLAALLPGLPITDLVVELGTGVPWIVDMAQSFLDVDDLVRRLDDHLRSGEINDGRGGIVNPDTRRAEVIDERFSTPRFGLNITGNIEPYLAVQELDQGRTIVVNDVQHHLGEDLIELHTHITRAFYANAQINCYVSIGEAPGFGTHWDDHDVLIIQLVGRKRWEVQSPHDVGSIKDVTPRGGTGQVVWSGILDRHRALYLPRGWPHTVTGFDGEISVHLTISIRRPRGLDLLFRLDPERFASGRIDVSAGDLDGMIATWRGSLSTLPTSGPVEVLAARQDAYAHHEVSLVICGGAVFVPDACDSEWITMNGNHHMFSFERSDAGLVALALRREWWTVVDLASAAGRSVDDVLRLIDRLGPHGLIHLRARDGRPQDGLRRR